MLSEIRLLFIRFRGSFKTQPPTSVPESSRISCELISLSVAPRGNSDYSWCDSFSSVTIPEARADLLFPITSGPLSDEGRLSPSRGPAATPAHPGRGPDSGRPPGSLRPAPSPDEKCYLCPGQLIRSAGIDEPRGFFLAPLGPRRAVVVSEGVNMSTLETELPDAAAQNVSVSDDALVVDLGSRRGSCRWTNDHGSADLVPTARRRNSRHSSRVRNVPHISSISLDLRYVCAYDCVSKFVR